MFRIICILIKADRIHGAKASGGFHFTSADLQTEIMKGQSMIALFAALLPLRGKYGVSP